MPNGIVLLGCPNRHALRLGFQGGSSVAEKLIGCDAELLLPSPYTNSGNRSASGIRYVCSGERLKVWLSPSKVSLLTDLKSTSFGLN